MILSLQPQKADSFRFAPPSRKTGVLKAFWGYVRSSEVIDFSRRLKRKKRQIAATWNVSGTWIFSSLANSVMKMLEVGRSLSTVSCCRRARFSSRRL